MSKKLTAKDVPAPEPPKMRLVKEDMFGPIPEGKTDKTFLFEALFFLFVFIVGFGLGLVIQEA